MRAILITRLYEFPSSKLGKETAENLTTFIESKINNELESQTHLATKADLAKHSLIAKEDIAQLSASMKEDIAQLRASTKEDIGRLDLKISDPDGQIIKGMF